MGYCKNTVKRLKFDPFLLRTSLYAQASCCPSGLSQCLATVTVSPPSGLPSVPQYQNFQNLPVQMPSVEKIFGSLRFHIRSNLILHT